MARRTGRLLTLTGKGRRLLADPGQLWRVTAAELVSGNAFTVFAGELFLAVLLHSAPLPAEQITKIVAQAADEEAFRDSPTGHPPGNHDISWAIRRTSNICRVLGLLAEGSDWPDRNYELTPVGTSTAMEALRPRYRPADHPVARPS
jgi:hypothetical protein